MPTGATSQYTNTAIILCVLACECVRVHVRDIIQLQQLVARFLLFDLPNKLQAGLAALREAIQSGRCNCAYEVDLLLSNTPVDVNAVDSTSGNTALHLAAQLTDEFDAVDVALVLLKHGADPDSKDTVNDDYK